jgi:hypothetical protein
VRGRGGLDAVGDRARVVQLREPVATPAGVADLQSPIDLSVRLLDDLLEDTGMGQREQAAQIDERGPFGKRELVGLVAPGEAGCQKQDEQAGNRISHDAYITGPRRSRSGAS